MGVKKLLLLALPIIAIPLLYLTVNEGDKISPTAKTSKILKNLYKCNELSREKREKCYLLNLTTKLSLDDNLSLIEQINEDSKTKQKIKSICHELTHVIGSSAYSKHKESSLISGYSSCGEGYYHGIMSELLVKDTTGKTLTDFCAKTTLDSKNLGLCYHGIGHTLLNNINTKKDKEFIEKIIKSCVEISTVDKINKIADNLSTLCFTGGFEEYMKIKYVIDQAQREKPSTSSCNNVSVKFTKHCYSILYSYEIISNLNSNTLDLNTIYQTFGEKCALLSSMDPTLTKIKEACFISMAKTYVNVVLTEDIENNNPTKKIADIETEQLYSIVTEICKKDFNDNCTIWFLLELNEKLPSDELDALVGKFEQLSLNDIFDFVF